MLLGVNIDHVATVRNARRLPASGGDQDYQNYPIKAAELATMNRRTLGS